MMSTSVSVKQRQSLPELQVKIKSQANRIEENRLLLVDFSHTSTCLFLISVLWKVRTESGNWFQGSAAFSGDHYRIQRI